MPYHDFEVLYNHGRRIQPDRSVYCRQCFSVKVLVQDVQYNPITGRVIHVDFRQINMKREMKAPVQLIFVGEAPAVKNGRDARESAVCLECEMLATRFGWFNRGGYQPTKNIC